jgi:two-component system, OmpR family, response regulator
MMSTLSSGAARNLQKPLIYVVEDDNSVAQVLQRILNEFDFHVEVFGTAAAIIRRLQSERPDLCIVDLGLPDMDGIELMSHIGRLSNCGLLVVTGRGHTIDRVMGLELGADDYVVKPFEPRELVARVRSILRRRTATGGGGAVRQHRFAHFLGWTLDCGANQLRAPDGQDHLLGTAEAQVLRAFLERPHQILTREQLLGQRDISPLDRSIDVRISRLRRRLEADPQQPKVIKTVYGSGYMLSAMVEWS